MAQEGAQQSGLVLNGAGGAAGPAGKVRQVERGGVGERIGLQVGPEIRDRVELRGVRREVRQMRGAGRGAFLDELTEMSLEAVPDQHDRGAQLALQIFEEVHDLLGVDVGIGQQAEVQSDPVAARSHTQGSDGRDFLMAAGALRQQRGVAPQALRAAYQRRHQQAGLVEKDQCGSQAGSVFFTRGQSCSIQARMRSSSRSTARRVGFCGEKPKPCRRRLTCAA